MPKLILVAPDPTPAAIERLLGALCDECAALGIVAEDLVGEAPVAEPNTVAVALCTAEDVPLVDSAHGPPILALLVGGASRATGAEDDPALSLASLVESAAGVFATDLQGVELLARLGFQAQRLLCGHTRRWDHRKVVEERDVDALINVPSGPAAHLLAGRVVARLAHLDTRVILTDDALTAAGPEGFLPADRRGLLLARARCFVALGAQIPNWFPCVEAMLAGCAVVAEDPRGLDPLMSGRELVDARQESTAGAVIALLRDSAYRHRVTSRAYLTLRCDLPLHRALGQLYQAARLVVRAQPAAGPRLGATLTGGNAPERASIHAGASAPSRIAQPAHRGCAEAFNDEPAAERRARWGFQTGGVQLTATSAGYLASAGHAYLEPSLSAVVIVGAGGCRYLHGTLDSLEATDWDGLEIVVVEDMPAKPSAADWIAAHPKQVAVSLRRSRPGGARAARRTALELARARHCVLLDAGIVLAPHALRQLRETLAAGRASRVIEGMVALEQEGGLLDRDVQGLERGRDAQGLERGKVSYGVRNALLAATLGRPWAGRIVPATAPVIAGFPAAVEVSRLGDESPGSRVGASGDR
jgi:hypothetical protein